MQKVYVSHIRQKKKITVWLYSSVWKKTGSVGRSVGWSDFFSYVFCGFDAQKTKVKPNTSILKGQMIYYTTKVLVRNILQQIIHFCPFFGKFYALKFWRKKKQVWEENLIFFFFFFFLIDLKKKLGRPCTLGSVGGVQPNNFFFCLIITLLIHVCLEVMLKNTFCKNSCKICQMQTFWRHWICKSKSYYNLELMLTCDLKLFGSWSLASNLQVINQLSVCH